MTDPTAELTLGELRDFRNEFRDFRNEVNAWRQETAERITTLEAHDHDISGNGQPGRMADVEKKVSQHSRVFWVCGGVWAAIQTMLKLHWIPFVH